MKRVFAVVATSFVFFCLVIACNKKSEVVNINANNTSPTAYLPLTVGNTWIYQDSTFDSTNAVKRVITDTAQVINQSQTVSGNVYWVVSETDTNGCFGNAGYYSNYIDQNGNHDILGLDSAIYPYFFWGTTSYDASMLVPTYTDFTNLSCGITENIYGFTTPYSINGFTCYKNIFQRLDCRGTESYVAYVSKGTGIVRFEYWEPKSTTSSYLQFSQTLTKYIPK